MPDKFHRILRQLTFFFTAFWAVQVVDAETIIIQDNNQKIDLGYHFEFMADPDHQYDIQQVSSGKANYLFGRSNTANPNFGMTKSAYWVRFSLKNESTHRTQFLLEIKNPFLDYVDLYYSQAYQWISVEGGDQYAFSHRQVKNRHHVFPIHLPIGESATYYIRVRSENGALQFPATLWTQSSFTTHHHELQFIFGINYGMIIFIIINNLFLFWSVRHYSDLYYVIAMICSLLFVAALNGHGYEYLWTDNIWIQNNILPILMISVSFWTTIFCRNFLDTKIHIPKTDKMLLILIGVQAVTMILPLVVPYVYSVSINSIASILAFMTLLVAGIMSVRRKVPSSGFFVIAFSLYLFGLVVYRLKSWAFIPLTPVTEYSVQIGAVLQVVLISFAMSDKVKRLQKERSKAQKEALRLQQEITENLEQKVIERTTQIETQAKEIEMAYRNVEVLARIGQEITSSLNFEEIFHKLYNYVNKVMDASMFGVDIYYPERAEVEYKFNIENDQSLPSEVVSMREKNNLSVWTIKNRAEILMNDVEAESSKFVPNLEFVSGSWPGSVIYIPLIIGSRVLGCVTVQSFHKNAYDAQDVDVMKTLASYAVIALDHAKAYDTLRTANNSTMQSIRYAKRIQEAVLPSHKKLIENFEDSFIFYEPRDIVSGDFYWFSEVNGLKLIAAVDCTGHGVPGAFMTMMGNDLLNHVVNDEEITEPSEILYALDRKVQRTLHIQTSMANQKSIQGRNDGMDMSLVVIDEANQKIAFAGAKCPLFYIQNGQEFLLKGSKFPIGSSQFNFKKSFETQEIAYQKGDVFYMYSDGFQDQFGGEEGRKYLSKRFRRFLTHMSQNPLREQRRMLKKELRNWQGRNRQTDDILVIAFKM